MYRIDYLSLPSSLPPPPSLPLSLPPSLPPSGATQAGQQGVCHKEDPADRRPQNEGQDNSRGGAALTNEPRECCEVCPSPWTLSLTLPSFSPPNHNLPLPPHPSPQPSSPSSPTFLSLLPPNPNLPLPPPPSPQPSSPYSHFHLLPLFLLYRFSPSPLPSTLTFPSSSLPLFSSLLLSLPSNTSPPPPSSLPPPPSLLRYYNAWLETYTEEELKRHSGTRLSECWEDEEDEENEEGEESGNEVCVHCIYVYITCIDSEELIPAIHLTISPSLPPSLPPSQPPSLPLSLAPPLLPPSLPPSHPPSSLPPSRVMMSSLSRTTRTAVAMEVST